MIRVKEAVIVEGRYDKIRLSSLIDGLIITTDGFGIFKNKEKMNMLRHLARTRGLLVLTDSAGTPTFPTSRARNGARPSVPRRASSAWRGCRPRCC